MSIPASPATPDSTQHDDSARHHNARTTKAYTTHPKIDELTSSSDDLTLAPVIEVDEIEQTEHIEQEWFTKSKT